MRLDICQPARLRFFSNILPYLWNNLHTVAFKTILSNLDSRKPYITISVFCKTEFEQSQDP